MATQRGFSIGELSKRTGVPVKTLRFYSDEGLLPPTGRTARGYRLYGDASVMRLDLIRTLREAGLGIDRIRAVLGRELSLADALRLQLRAVEAHLTSLKHVASALRAALRSEPTERDLRRLYAVTRLSNEERRAVIEGFYERVSEGVPIDAQWRKSMVEASAPRLPDEPTPEQLDAWIELAGIVEDPAFVEAMRAGAKQTWTADFDPAAYKVAADAMVAEANALIARGVQPDGAEAKAVVERCFAGFAAAMKRAPDEDFRKELRARFAEQDPRAARYWELVRELKGAPRADDDAKRDWPDAAWKWFVRASLHHFP